MPPLRLQNFYDLIILLRVSIRCRTVRLRMAPEQDENPRRKLLNRQGYSLINLMLTRVGDSGGLQVLREQIPANR